ncbi:MAG: 2-C-methyl-D-erythritol 4-phosphate cytidylyltransferase [Bacteroidales bacterium]|nr:2-C-methyl-D-erythritol 4-phosphate cytidylyltransferase [Bacteroidales bacterium]
MNVAAILSGGTGTRAKAGMPKQFVNLGGKMVIERTIEAFNAHPQIDEIIVVSHPDYTGMLKEIQLAYEKWHLTVEGGSERYLSSWAAIRACENFKGNLLIHDAARPNVSSELISRVIMALADFPAAVPVLPLTDTLLEADGDCVKCVPLRQNFRNAQTPQGFHLDVIRHAFQLAMNDVNCCFTDDCSVVLHYLPAIKVKMVNGDFSNQKLTYHSDIEYFIKLFEKKR